MSRRRYARLRVLSFNVHVGLAIPAIGWLLARLPMVHVVAIQEAQRPWAKRALLKSFPEKRWHCVGPDVGAANKVGTFVFARRKRFALQQAFNRKLMDGLDDGMFPQRNLVAAELVDRITGRVVDVSSVHTWHMKGRELGGPGDQARGHDAQVKAYADHHTASAAQHPGSVQIAVGDWNEDIDGRQPGDPELHVRRQLRSRAGMQPASTLALAGDKGAHFDDAFVRVESYVKVLSRQSIKVPFKAADHPATLVTLGVEPLRPPRAA